MSTSARERYLQEILGHYRDTPGTRGRVRPADRRLAEDLFRRGVEPLTLRAALLLAAARRAFRDPELGPIEPIQSLHYFLPVLEEIQRQPLDPGYVRYLEEKLAELDSTANQNHRSP